MLYGAAISFEVRAEGGATRLRGAFPYDAETTLGDGRRERFAARAFRRSEEHTSELQSLMRISYAVFCLKKKNHANNSDTTHINISALHILYILFHSIDSSV